MTPAGQDNLRWFLLNHENALGGLDFKVRQEITYLFCVYHA